MLALSDDRIRLFVSLAMERKTKGNDYHDDVVFIYLFFFKLFFLYLGRLSGGGGRGRGGGRHSGGGVGWAEEEGES